MRNKGLGTLVATFCLFTLSFAVVDEAVAGNALLRAPRVSNHQLSIEDRLQIIEAKLQVHEKTLAEKLGDCQLEFQRIGRRATWCTEGSVVTEVEKIYGTEMLSVTCAKPVLKCEKLGINIEL